MKKLATQLSGWILLTGLLVCASAESGQAQFNPTYFEKPETDQLYPRDCNDQAIVTIDVQVLTSLQGNWNTLCLKVYQKPQGQAESLLQEDCRTLPTHGGNHRLLYTPSIQADLIEYRFELIWKQNSSVIATKQIASSVVSGDVYLIQGQSWATADPTHPAARHIANESPFSKSFGHNTDCNLSPSWGKSQSNPSLAGALKKAHFVGVWGLILQKELQDQYSMPTCIINGAVGGTGVHEHVPTATNHACGSANNLFERLEERVQLAKLENHIKGIFWWDAWGWDASDPNEYPRFQYQTFFDYFDQLYQGWQSSFPDYAKTYFVQTTHCCEGFEPEYRDHFRDMLSIYPYLEVVSDHALEADAYTFPRIDPCHYDYEANEIFGLRMAKILGRDFYCDHSNGNVSSPNIQQAYYKDNPPNNVLVLEFDQNMADPAGLESYFHFDTGSINGTLGPAHVNGNKIELPVSSNNITKVTYMDQANLMGNIPQIWYDGVTPACYVNGQTLSFANPPFSIFWLTNSDGVPALSFFEIAVGNPPTTGSISYWQNVANGYTDNLNHINTTTFCGAIGNGVFPNHWITTCNGSQGAAEVSSGNNTEFRGAFRVSLKPGFHAQSGSNFLAIIHAVNFDEKTPKKDCCSGTSMRLKALEAGSAVEDKTSSLQIVPNPNAGQFRLKGLKAEPFNMIVSSINGKVFMNRQQKNGSAINLAGIRPGLYLIRIDQAGKTYHAKLIINPSNK